MLEDLDEMLRFKKWIICCKECKIKWGIMFGVDEFEVFVLKVKVFRIGILNLFILNVVFYFVLYFL